MNNVALVKIVIEIAKFWSFIVVYIKYCIMINRPQI